MADKTAFSMSLTVEESKKLHRGATAKGLTVSNYIRELTGLPATKRGRRSLKPKASKVAAKKTAKKAAKKK